MPQLGSTKSRRGCKRCKQRRVKCDEQIPCGACQKRNEQCSLVAATASETPEETAGPSSTELWTLDLYLSPRLLLQAFVIDETTTVQGIDVSLCHHIVPPRCTRGSLPSLARLHTERALEYPFLMHGLLALAALHLAYIRTDRSTKYLQICDKHQGIALRTFNSILSSPTISSPPIDPGLADALFALAATLSVSSMARSCARVETAALDMDAITELFMMTRGIKNIIHLSFEHIKSGPMSVMLENRQYPEGVEVHLPPSVSSSFNAIRDMLATCGLDHEATRHCRYALDELEKVYGNIAYISPGGEVEIGDCSKWQVVVSMDYIRLIEARSPPALVILAYYAAVFTAVHRAWYTQTWAEYALRGISEVLDASMQHWIE